MLEGDVIGSDKGVLELDDPPVPDNGLPAPGDDVDPNVELAGFNAVSGGP